MYESSGKLFGIIEHIPSLNPKRHMFSNPLRRAFLLFFSAVIAFSGVVFFATPTQADGGNNQNVGHITEFAIPTPDSDPTGITRGPDGAVWFTEYLGNKIGRLATDGTFKEFALPTPRVFPNAIILGSDGALWFDEYGPNQTQIGRITPDGTITEYTTTSLGVGFPRILTPGPDGAVWFLFSTCFPDCHDTIARITPDGQISSVRTFSGYYYNLRGLTLGPDNAVWFMNAVPYMNGICRITPDSSFTCYPVTLSDGDELFGSITSGPDGAPWFTTTGRTNIIGRMTTDGSSFTQYAPGASDFFPSAITSGPDQSLWFLDGADKIDRITTDGAITKYGIPTKNADSEGITLGPDQNIWFTETNVNQIGQAIAQKHSQG